MKPIHIMRWAPADYLMDAFVAGCYRRGEYRTLAFYSGFLFRSHLEGGSLPAEPEALADHLGMRQGDVAAALSACVKAGKLVVEDGRVYHKRVVKAVSDEIAYRQEQSRLGLKGAEKRYGPKGSPGDPQSGPHSPPAPAPTPAPVPAPGPDPAPAPAPTDGALALPARSVYVAEVWKAYCTATGRDPGVSCSSAEWSVAVGWYDDGVPLRVVLRGIKDCLERNPEKKPRSLAYLIPAVEEAARFWRKASA